MHQAGNCSGELSWRLKLQNNSMQWTIHTTQIAKLDTLLKREDLNCSMIGHLFTADSLNLSCFGFEQWHSGEPTTWKWKWSSWVTLPLSQRRPWEKLFHSSKQWKTLDSMLFRKETSWSSKQYETLKTQRCSRFIDPDTIKKISSIVI